MQEYRTKINESGRIVIPARLRKECDLSPGDDVIIKKLNGGIYISTLDDTIKDIQKRMKKYIKPGESIVDEFLKFRKEDHDS